MHTTAFVGPGVTLGTDVAIGPMAVVLGPCVIGDGVWIGPGSKIGSPPEISSLRQNTAWTGDLDHKGVVIGAGAVIRENVVIHQGSHRATTVGDGAWILNSAYLAHDTQVGAGATVSAGVMVGGHSEIGEGANIGMNATIHQRRLVAPGAMVGMGTPVTRDIPPFAKAYGTPPRVYGVNAVGMRRAGIPDTAVEALAALYLRETTALDAVLGAESWAGHRALLEWWSARSDLRAAQPAGGSR